MLSKTEQAIRSLPGNSFLPGNHFSFNEGTGPGIFSRITTFDPAIHTEYIFDPGKNPDELQAQINYEYRALNLDVVNFIGQSITEKLLPNDRDPVLSIHNQLVLKRKQFVAQFVDAFTHLHTGMNDHIDYYPDPEEYGLELSNPTLFLTDYSLESISQYLTDKTRNDIGRNLGNLIVVRFLNPEDLEAPESWMPFHTGINKLPTVYSDKQLEEFNGLLQKSDQERLDKFYGSFKKAQVVNANTNDKGLSYTDNDLSLAFQNKNF